MTSQLITRKGSMDVAHKVLHHAGACAQRHGHTYLFELTFSFTQSKEIGYALDFKEIKRVGCEWINDYLDHGSIVNPIDINYLNLVRLEESKHWEMSLNGVNKFCNPTVENIAKEMFMAQEILFESYQNLQISQIRLYETPNCYTDCFKESISEEERKNFYAARYEQIKQYANKKGIVEYDDRKLNCSV